MTDSISHLKLLHFLSAFLMMPSELSESLSNAEWALWTAFLCYAFEQQYPKYMSCESAVKCEGGIAIEAVQYYTAVNFTVPAILLSLCP